MSHSKSRLRVVEIKVHNVRGLEDFDLAAGDVNEIVGGNGVGKSSVLAAVELALTGGTDIARVARLGAEDSEISLVLAGQGEEFRVVRDSDGLTVLRRIGATAAWEKVARPQETLRGLFDSRGCNPARFLAAKPGERVTMLLQALLLQPLQETEVRRLLAGIRPEAVVKRPSGLHPLAELALLRQGVYDARTGVNVSARQKADGAGQLARDLPATLPADTSTALREAQDEVQRLAREVGEAETTAAAEEKAALTAAAQKAASAGQANERARLEQHRKAFDAHSAWAAEERRKVEVAVAEKLAEVSAEAAAVSEGARIEAGRISAVQSQEAAAARAARAEATQATDAIRERLAGAREAVAGLQATAESASAVRALAREAEKLQAEAASLQGESEALTAAMERLDAYRRQLADTLPIPGLEIVGEDLHVDGVPWDQVNTGRQNDVAARVSMLRASSRLPVVFMDRAESLDPQRRAALVAALREHGAQVFLATVTDGALAVDVRA